MQSPNQHNIIKLAEHRTYTVKIQTSAMKTYLRPSRIPQCYSQSHHIYCSLISPIDQRRSLDKAQLVRMLELLSLELLVKGLLVKGLLVKGLLGKELLGKELLVKGLGKVLLVKELPVKGLGKVLLVKGLPVKGLGKVLLEKVVW